MPSPPNNVAFDLKDNTELFDSPSLNYVQSKAANLLLSVSFARRYAADGIVSVCFNPGSLKGKLHRHDTRMRLFLANKIFLHPVVVDAYTELCAGWSRGISLKNSIRRSFHRSSLGLHR